MKPSTLLFPAALVGLASAQCPLGDFQPEKLTDTRGVCPMLNTLANHGFLPRNGRDIDVNQTVYALNEALNLTPDFGQFLFSAGRLANPEPNATTFNLDHLNRHDFFEHDGSLSRQDAYFGQWSRFNQTVWDWTLETWPDDILDIKSVANARAQRQITSNLTNPEYSLSQVGYLFSVAESSALLSIIGNKISQTTPKKFVDYLFVNERLPCAVGWQRSEAPISLNDLVGTFIAIEQNTAFPPPPPPDNSTQIFSKKAKRWNPHIGYY
ncbi:Cloroperoxidase [Xylariaceae sp. AK1471]|nr:Cloroperoxidase [Xylariaceae sp. AK1471]